MFRLYELIWLRTVASQMKDAVGHSVTVRVGGAVSSGRDGSSSPPPVRTITFHGFLKAYVEGADDPDAERDDARSGCRTVTEGDALTAVRLRPSATRPSRRPATPKPR